MLKSIEKKSFACGHQTIYLQLSSIWHEHNSNPSNLQEEWEWNIFSRKRRVWLEGGLFRKGEGLWFDIKFLFKKIKNIKMLHNFFKFSKSFFET